MLSEEFDRLSIPYKQSNTLKYRDLMPDCTCVYISEGLQATPISNHYSCCHFVTLSTETNKRVEHGKAGITMNCLILFPLVYC